MKNNYQSNDNTAQFFEAITEKQWRHVKCEHETMSERHKKYLQLNSC